MPPSAQVAGILFADVVGFSRLKENSRILEVQGHIRGFLERHVPDDVLYKNSWGDALLIVQSDPNDSLECAVSLREWFRSKNWGRIGFENPMQIRIGLHSERLNLIVEGGKIVDVSGAHVNSAARIEPIVPPDSIYCSESFHILAKHEAHGYVAFEDLGDRELAKSFGQMRLYKVLAKDNTKEERPQRQEAFGFSVPRIRKSFTDSEKQEFLENAFASICSYLQKASDALAKTDTDIQAKHTLVTPGKLTLEIYVKGDRRATGQFWLSKAPFSQGIHYSQTIQSADNSYNESFNVDSDGYSLSLHAAMSLRAQGTSRLSVQEAANYCWKLLTDQLQ